MKRELSIVLCLLLLPGMTGVKASADSPEKKTASAMNNKQNVRQKITPVGTRKSTSVRPLSVCEVKVNLPTDSMLLSWVDFLSPSVTEAPKVEEVRQTVRGSIVLDYSRGQKTKYDERNFVEAVYKLLAVTRPLKETPGVSLEGIRLTGYTAPDGDYRANERLGLQRALALKDYIRREKSFGTVPFEVNWIAEDWKGLTDLIVGSEMAFKESVLDIIRTVDVVDADGFGGWDCLSLFVVSFFREVTSHRVRGNLRGRKLGGTAIDKHDRRGVGCYFGQTGSILGGGLLPLGRSTYRRFG